MRESAAVSFERSDGFMYDRDFKTAIVRSRTSFGDRSGLSVSYLWKEFGANNFYGGNAPSREWTNQTLVAADHRFGEVGGWSIDGQASYRTHGDRFLFNQLHARAVRQPASHARCARLGQWLPACGWTRLAHRWTRRRRRLDPLHQPWRSRDGSHQRVWRVAAGDWRAACSSKACFASITYDEFGTSVESIARCGMVGDAVRPSSWIDRSRLPCADVHRALLLGSSEPGARRRRPGDRVGRGRRR